MKHSKINPNREYLVERAVSSEGAKKLNSGALTVTTGKCTGRSPKAKFIVKDSITEGSVDWNNNTACTLEEFDLVKSKVLNAMNASEETYVQQVYAGHDPSCRIKVEVNTSLAWQSIFVKNMFIEVAEEDNFKSYYIDSIFNTIWQDGLNMNDENIVQKVLKNLNVNPKTFFLRSTSSSVKDLLKKRTGEAYDKGIFGAPSFVVNNKIFWGQDRIEFALNEFNK